MVGEGAYAEADGSRHPGRIFPVLVGESAKARKSTAWANVRRVLETVDPSFFRDHCLSGFGSGEAVVDAVKTLGNDPRMLVIQPEWSRTLRVAERSGSILSDLIRQCWDGGRLEVRSRIATSVADNAQVVIVGAITSDEIGNRFKRIDLANGFANRHLFTLVRRSKLIPTGKSISDSTVAGLAKTLAIRLSDARTLGLMHRTPPAEEMWAKIYAQLSDDDPGGNSRRHHRPCRCTDASIVGYLCRIGWISRNRHRPSRSCLGALDLLQSERRIVLCTPSE